MTKRRHIFFVSKVRNKDPKIQEAMVRIHQIAQAYSQRPSQLLFPWKRNPNFQLLIDNAVFEIGYKWELEGKLKDEEHKHKTDADFLKSIISLVRH